MVYIDLTLEDDDVGEVPPPPAKRQCPANPFLDDDVVLVDVTKKVPTSENLEEGEELRITGGHVEVWNKDLPHQRHHCGTFTFTASLTSSNAAACTNCYCFVCDTKASECSSWGNGSRPSDHCNANPGDRYYLSLKVSGAMTAAASSSFTTPGPFNVGVSSQLATLDTPATRPAGRTPAPGLASPSNGRQWETPYRPAPPALDPLPAPTGPDLVELGEIRLRCKAVDGSTIQQLDGRILRYGVFCTIDNLPSHLTQDAVQEKLHIGSAFQTHPGSSINVSASGRVRPLELLPFHVPPQEVVPPERTVAVTVLHCGVGYGAVPQKLKTAGLTVWRNGLKVTDLLEEAKRIPSLCLLQEPPGGLVIATADSKRGDFHNLNILPRHDLDQPWNNPKSHLFIFVPGVPVCCKIPLSQMQSDSADLVRLSVILTLPVKATPTPGSEARRISFRLPLMLNVDMKTALGGKDAAKAVKEAVIAAMRHCLRFGRAPLSPNEVSLIRQWKRSDFSLRKARPSGICNESGWQVMIIYAHLASTALRKYSFNSWCIPNVHFSADPEVLEASWARAEKAAAQSREIKEASDTPYDTLREMVTAQRCSKPRNSNAGDILRGIHRSTSVTQDHIPSLCIRLHLEPDTEDPTVGTAVFRLWAWSNCGAPAELNKPTHESLLSKRPAYHSKGWCCMFSEGLALLPKTRKLLTAGVPGIQEMEANTQAWQRKSGICSADTLLQALETGEIGAAQQPPGLAVTLRPYQLQTLGFMQRAERGEGLRRHVWVPIKQLTTSGSSSNPQEEERPAWWWSPAFSQACLHPEPSATWGGFLGETMGLGKTVEVLALILSDRPHLPPVPRRLSTLFPPDHPNQRQQPAETQASGSDNNSPSEPDMVNGRICSSATLVVCAVPLVGQWVDEARSKAGGSLRIHQYHGQGRTRNIKQLATQYDVVVTTYATLGSDYSRVLKARSAMMPVTEAIPLSPLHGVQWYRLVLDESHCAKESKSSQTKACVHIEAARRWCCSATPITTNIMDLHGQFEVLRMAPFSNKATFAARYKDSMLDHQLLPRHELFYVLSQMMVRHTKSQCIGGETVLSLPPLQRSTGEVKFSPREETAYLAAHATAEAAFKLFVAEGKAAVSKNTLIIMSLLLPLRRIASGGVLTEKDLRLEPWAAVKAEEASQPELGVNAPVMPAEAQCAVCLDVPEAPVKTVCGHLFCRECIFGVLQAARSWGGSTSASCPMCRRHVDEGELAAGCLAKVEPGPQLAARAVNGDSSAPCSASVPKVPFESKLKALVNELRAMRSHDPTAKALVFSQFMGTIEWLKKRLPAEGFDFRYINGAMSMKRRAKAIADFQGNPSTTVFLLSLRAGAVGINLTAASHVFLLEPALNPALEEQAIGRAWRMGQQRPVVVKCLFVKGTVEENIMKLNKRRSGDGQQRRGSQEGSTSDSIGGKGKVAAQGVAGSLLRDLQNLKLEELSLLFLEPNFGGCQQAAL